MPSKLLIVDDSALMRRQLQTLFTQQGGFEVQLARNGVEAIEANRVFQPDVITLDINMPEMDGITALSHIMSERPTAVVMLSSLTERGALATFEALNLGAVDYLAKPGGTISLSIDTVQEELLRKVKAAARARPRWSRNGGARPATVAAAPSRFAARATARTSESVRRGNATDFEGLVVIGVSTGGPRVLEELLSELPSDFPWPVLIAQHMPAAFTKPFAERLDAASEVTVVEVDKPMPLERGVVYLARGGTDMVITRRAGVLTALPRPEHSDHLWHPSVELLAQSVLANWDAKATIAVMLTGMGNDGAATFAEIRKAGGRTIAESEDSCVVFGMPGDLVHRGGASMVLPSERIARQLITWTSR